MYSSLLKANEIRSESKCGQWDSPDCRFWVAGEAVEVWWDADWEWIVERDSKEDCCQSGVDLNSLPEIRTRRRLRRCRDAIWLDELCHQP